MPVLDIRRNLNDLPGLDLHRRLAACLIEAYTPDSNQHLSTRVPMPVVAATGLKGDVPDGNAQLFLARRPWSSWP